MKTIWKFEVGSGMGIYDVKMPLGSKVISVDNQCGIICVWAEVESDNSLAYYNFFVRGTEQPFEHEDYDDEYSDFVGTVQIDDWMWHVYLDLRSFNIEE